MREYNLVGIACGVSRAYEIAKAGNFSVKIVAGRDVSQNDVDLFNKFYAFDASDNPDIIVELAFSSQDIFTYLITSRKCESIEDINNRVAKHDFSDLKVDWSLNSTCLALLKTAVNRLQLGIHDVLKIIDIATAIAKLAESTTIKPEHIAEAIQYRSIKL
jgi:hypothetical protein